MAARRAPAPPKEEPDVKPPEEPAGDGGADGGAGAAGEGEGGEDAHIRTIVREVLADFFGGDEPGDGDGAPAEGGGGRLIDEERAVERRVRAELERVKAASELEDVKETVKKIVEKAPVKWRRSTRFMGWVGEDDR